VRFQNVAGGFIVASKFASFHVPFCDMACCCCGQSIKSAGWVVVWGGDFEILLFNVAVRFCVIMLVFLHKVCLSKYTDLTSGSTIYFWYFVALGFLAKQIGRGLILDSVSPFYSSI
jgi:hypothetical protein